MSDHPKWFGPRCFPSPHFQVQKGKFAISLSKSEGAQSLDSAKDSAVSIPVVQWKSLELDESEIKHLIFEMSYKYGDDLEMTKNI